MKGFASIPPYRIRFGPQIQQQGRHAQVVFLHGHVQRPIAAFVAGVNQFRRGVKICMGRFQVALPNDLAGALAYRGRFVPVRNRRRQHAGYFVVSTVPGPIQRRHVVFQSRSRRRIRAVVEQQTYYFRVPFPDGEVERLVICPVAVRQPWFFIQQILDPGQVPFNRGQQHVPYPIWLAIHEMSLLVREIGANPFHNTVSECVVCRRRIMVEVLGEDTKQAGFQLVARFVEPLAYRTRFQTHEPRDFSRGIVSNVPQQCHFSKCFRQRFDRLANLFAQVLARNPVQGTFPGGL